MEFTSTKNSSVKVSLREAVLSNMPGDGGLYTPVSIPAVDTNVLAKIRELPFAECAKEVLSVLLGDSLHRDVLSGLCDRAFSFPVPLVSVNEQISTLELFHGPTLAFKDVGVRFMAELMSYYRNPNDRPVTILTATSGDTGGAVASAFHNRPGFEVIILYPRGKVSHLQELQISALGGNVKAIEVDGNFDDCQRFAKRALVDTEIAAAKTFSSANSINVARLLPQVNYYFHAWSQLPESSEVVFSVPSGNFGNICAGLIAKRMGLPVKKFVAATNSNDIVPRYLNSGRYEVRPFVETLSTAMDIADPSNFIRAQALYRNSYDGICQDLSGLSINDEETKAGIRELLIEGYFGEPHGAVAYKALKQIISGTNLKGIFLGTAHPIKFKEVVEGIIQKSVPIPLQGLDILQKAPDSVKIPPDFDILKQKILQFS